MKKFIVHTMIVLGFVLTYGFSSAQTTASCPKKGTPDCSLVKNCPLKGTKDCPHSVSTASLVTKNVKADCPLAGTADCPIEKCPLKGTKDCPLVKNATRVAYASMKTATKKSEEDLPPCCRKPVTKSN